MPSLLNDLSRPTRTATAGQTVGAGLLIGSLVGATRADGGNLGALAVLAFAGLFVFLVATVVFGVWLRRADRAFWRDLDTLGAELADGRAEGVTVPGRVVRRRIARRYPSYSTSSPDPQPAPSVVLVATVLTGTGARRAAALVPATVGLESREAPVLLKLHPVRDDVAILVTDVSPSQVRKGAKDPRWSSEPLPTDRTIVGGYLVLACVGVGGLLGGLAVGLVASLLLG